MGLGGGAEGRTLKSGDPVYIYISIYVEERGPGGMLGYIYLSIYLCRGERTRGHVGIYIYLSM